MSTKYNLSDSWFIEKGQTTEELLSNANQKLSEFDISIPSKIVRWESYSGEWYSRGMIIDIERFGQKRGVKTEPDKALFSYGFDKNDRIILVKENRPDGGLAAISYLIYEKALTYNYYFKVKKEKLDILYIRLSEKLDNFIFTVHRGLYGVNRELQEKCSEEKVKLSITNDDWEDFTIIEEYDAKLDKNGHPVKIWNTERVIYKKPEENLPDLLSQLKALLKEKILDIVEKNGKLYSLCLSIGGFEELLPPSIFTVDDILLEGIEDLSDASAWDSGSFFEKKEPYLFESDEINSLCSEINFHLLNNADCIDDLISMYVKLCKELNDESIDKLAGKDDFIVYLSNYETGEWMTYIPSCAGEEKLKLLKNNGRLK